MTLWGCLFCIVSLCAVGWSFFFSSRRRHTRCLSDWSSDVCSSDLAGGIDGCRESRGPTADDDDVVVAASIFGHGVPDLWFSVPEGGRGLSAQKRARQDRKSVV